MNERRRLSRVTPLQAIRARFEGDDAYVLDLSLSGFRIAHQNLIPAGSDAALFFEWDARPVEVTTAVQWSRLQRTGRTGSSRFYESGLQLLIASREASAVIRDCVESHILRALDERKANANGIPPLAARSVQDQPADRFARQEYVNGLWRKIVTAQADQSPYGFTVAAELPPRDANLLREAYTIADEPMRDFIRKLARMSITDREPIPVRKYEP